MASPRQPGRRCSNLELRRRLDYDDARLLAECEIHRHRASGPGGQHRNKVASAIRLHHQPSGLVASAAESRLQGENQRRALRRLRAAIALVARAPLPETINWPATVDVPEGRLRVNETNSGIHHVIALVLDALVACDGRLADAARCLGLTSSSFARFLRQHPQAWREAGHIREQAGLPPLRS